MQKDALQKDYSNVKYEQPYNTAIYNQSILFEAKRWHIHSYEEALVDLKPQHLQVLQSLLMLDRKDKSRRGLREALERPMASRPQKGFKLGGKPGRGEGGC